MFCNYLSKKVQQKNEKKEFENETKIGMAAETG